jgi:hypothetical protein
VFYPIGLLDVVAHMAESHDVKNGGGSKYVEKGVAFGSFARVAHISSLIQSPVCQSIFDSDSPAGRIVPYLFAHEPIGTRPASIVIVGHAKSRCRFLFSVQKPW